MLRPFVRGLKLVKLPNLKVIRLKRARIQLRKVPKIYSRLYCGGDAGKGGQVYVPNHTNLCKFNPFTAKFNQKQISTKFHRL